LKNKGIILVFLFVLSIVAVSGCTSNNNSNTSTSNSNSNSQTTAMQPLHFSGKAAISTSTFHLNSGFYRFNYTYKGSGNFIINLKKVNGASYDQYLIANIIGSGNSSKALNVQDGDYYLDVQIADGPWTVDVTQGS
jgi:ABC-type Fe3+-hydroxamate transport system substrate-binding protein